MITRLCTSCTTAATSKTKRARRGFEKNWNRFGDPLRRFLSGHFDKDRWLNYKRKKDDHKSS